MDVLTVGVLFVGMLGLDAEGVSAKVIPLPLKEVRRQVFAAVPVVEAQGGAEGRHRNAPEGALADDVSPAVLGVVDGLVEEVIEEQIFQVRVFPVCRGDVLQEHGPDDAAATPHESDRRLVELPIVVLGGLGGVE